MKRKSLKIIFAIALLLIITMTSVFAAPFDLIHINNPEKNHTFTEFVDSPTVFDEVVEDLEYYVIEAGNGNLYYVSEVNEATSNGASFNEAIAGLEPYIGETNEDITAEAVLNGSLLGIDNYIITVFGAENEEVDTVLINGNEVTFEIVDGNIMVNSSVEVESIHIVVNEITVLVDIVEDTIYTTEDLEDVKAEVDNLIEENYTVETWTNLEEALALPENTDEEIDIKVESIMIALENLVKKIEFLGTFNELFYENKSVYVEGIEYKGIEDINIPGIYNIYLDVNKLKDVEVVKSLDNCKLKMKIDGNYLMDGSNNELFSYSTDGFESFYILPAVQDGINSWTTISPSKIGVEDSSFKHQGEIYLINE